MRKARQASPLQMVILLVVLAGCGAAPKVSTTSTTSRQQQQQKMQAASNAMNACLKKAGYHFVGPPSDEASANMQFVTNNAADQQMVRDPGYKTAYDKCAASTGFKQLINSAGNRQPSAQDIQKANQGTLKLYTCMRQKGWTLADPTKNAQGMLTPPQPPSSVQGDQARMSQFGNDMNSCFKTSGVNGGVRTIGGGGGSSDGGKISASAGS